MKNFYFFKNLMGKEKGWVIGSILQMLFIIFFFLYAGWQMLYESSVLPSLYAVTSPAYCFSHIKKDHISSLTLDTVLADWIDQKGQACSFVSVPVNDSETLLIGIGEHSMDFFSAISPQKEIVYIADSDLSHYADKKFEFRSNINTDTMAFDVVPASRPLSRAVIGKGIAELDHTLLLFLDYQTFTKWFHYTLLDELIRNCIVFSDHAADVTAFCDAFDTAGYQMFAQSWQDEIQSYFIEQAQAGLMYAAFFLIAGIFIFYSIYVKLSGILSKYQSEFCVYYLCGISVKTLRIHMSMLLVFILLAAFLPSVCLSSLGGLTADKEWFYPFLFSVIAAVIFLTASITKIRNQISEQRIEETMDSE